MILTNAKLARNRKHLTQDELGRRAEVDRAVISRLERGFCASEDAAQRVATVLGIDAATLAEEAK